MQPGGARWWSQLVVVVIVMLALLVGCTPQSPDGSVAPDGPEPPSGRDELVAAVRDDPRFGGFWADDSGVLNVAVTRDVEEIRSSVAHLLIPGMPVRFQLVRYSYTELTATQMQILEDETKPDVTMVAIDPAANQVVVGIDPFDEEVAEELTSRYGPVVKVVHQRVQTQL